MRVARIAWCVLTLVAGICTTVPQIQAEDAPKNFKAPLFARYNRQNLNVVHPKILVSYLSGPGGDAMDYLVGYGNFHSAIAKTAWQPKYRGRNLLDEYTVEEVSSRATFTEPLEVGELIQVRRLKVNATEGFLVVELGLVALDNRRVARLQTTYADGGTGLMHKIDFGMHFRFIIPPPVPGASDSDYVKEITGVIDRYFLPADEYQAREKSAAEKQEAQKNVEIKPGMTKAEVFSALGDPQKTITFGEKTFLKYADFTVELVSDKVTDVKTD